MQVVVHPNFTNYQHDLALLRLPRALTRPALRPLCLPPDTEEEEEEDSFLGLRCVATGWGQTTQEGDLEPRLHQVSARHHSDIC